MSIFKNFRYTQVDKDKYQKSMALLTEGKDITTEEFYAISYNLNKVDNPLEILQKLLESNVEEKHKKKLTQLMSLEEVVSLIDNQKKYVQYFMYPKILPISGLLLIVSFILKPMGIGIIATYLILSMQISKSLRKKLLKQFQTT